MSARQPNGPSAMRKGDGVLGNVQLHVDGLATLAGLAQRG